MQWFSQMKENQKIWILLQISLSLFRRILLYLTLLPPDSSGSILLVSLILAEGCEETM